MRETDAAAVRCLMAFSVIFSLLCYNILSFTNAQHTQWKKNSAFSRGHVRASERALPASLISWDTRMNHRAWFLAVMNRVSLAECARDDWIPRDVPEQLRVSFESIVEFPRKTESAYIRDDGIEYVEWKKNWVIKLWKKQQQKQKSINFKDSLKKRERERETKRTLI